MEESTEKLWQMIGERLDGVKKLISVSEEPAVGKYENYASDMKRLTLRVLTEDGSEETMCVVQKSKKPSAEGTYDFVEELGVFKTESMVYDELLRQMEKLMVEQWPEETPFWPKCLGFGQNEIIMEDLKALGYRLTPKHEALDLPHALIAIRALAKFHALGLVLMERKIFDPSKLRRNLFGENNEFLNNILKNGLSMLSEAIKTSWGPEWQDAAARIDKAKENLGEKLKKLSEESEGDFNVINHGDCWSNNMMFKYDEDTKTPTSVRLFDFQFCDYRCPGWDLNCFLHASVFPDVRIPHLSHLLSEYTQTLGESCQWFGYRGKVPDLTQVRQMYKQIGYFGFAAGVTNIPLLMMSTEIDMVLDLEKISRGFQGFDDYYKKEYFEDERVIRNMKAEVKYATEQQII